MLDRSGKDLEIIGKSAANYFAPRFSHDAKRVAVGTLDPATQKSDRWVIHVARGTSTRLTFDPENDGGPACSRGDRVIYFAGARSGRGDIFAKSSFGTGTDSLVHASPNQDVIARISADGASACLISSRGMQSRERRRYSSIPACESRARWSGTSRPTGSTSS